MTRGLLMFICMFWVSSLSNIHAQTLGAFCGSDAMNSQNSTNFLDDQWEHYYYADRTFTEAIYTLPIVVHIIHNGGTSNISDAQVLAAIEFLNQSFENIAYYDSTTGVNTEIQFCLASQDENGDYTSGITRNVSLLTNMTMEAQDLDVKNIARWNPFCFVNIYVVNSINSTVSGTGVVAYATFPASHGLANDGIVIEAGYFGSSAGNNSVLTHEMGHYLGLYHTFQGACLNNNCLTDGDKVCDTPPDASTAAIPCAGSVNTCHTDALSGFSSDVNDLHRDYMDYGDLNCFNQFTNDQKLRMHFFYKFG